MVPGVVLLHGPTGVWLTLATVTVLAVVSALLPLRGGHGQHAQAGPGALHVWQLARSDTPCSSRSERNFRPVYASESSVHSPQPEPESEPDEVGWPIHDPDRPRTPPAPRGASLLERELVDALAPDTGHIGRHRLVERHEVDLAAPPPLVELCLSRMPVPATA